MTPPDVRAAAADRQLVSRRARRLLVAAEATVATAVGGLAIGGAFGHVLVAAAASVVPVALLARRLRPAVDPARSGRELLRTLHVLGVPSRSTGEVGVIGDGQGYAAGVEVDLSRGVSLDVAALVGALAEDPSRLSGVQLRITSQLPPADGRRAAPTPPVYRRLHVVARFEPTWASDVVESHGGGARGSRAALVAAVDRAVVRLRRTGVANRVVDAAALSTLLAEDTAPQWIRRTLAADLVDDADLRRVVDLLRAVGPQRSVVSVCIDFAGQDRWYSRAFVQLSGASAAEVAASAEVLVADDAVSGTAPPSSLASVLPLGGGPGELTSYLTLART